ncbi:hypothetical protein [Marilutibacter aestuarii]|uniref:hypothetical protein n=1 Tax=Marilutibacter aestuarii TaxID=1706195 RepID=UPI0011450019|nr:hypothetical protein [Lysobacter aestuarii]
MSDGTAAQAGPGPEAGQGVEILATGMDAMAKLGGSMQAAAEACGQGSKTELDAARRQQKEMFVRQGGSEAAFDAAFEQAYASARAKFEATTDSERQAACSELSQFPETM